MPAPLPVDHTAFYGLCIQAGAIVASAVGVIATLWQAGRVARRRATLDLIMTEQTNPTMIDARIRFTQLKKQGSLVNWALPEKSGSEEASLIKNILNRYELIAIAVSKKTIDEGIYKDWLRTGYVREWITLKPFVVQARQNRSRPTLYCEFEKIALRWADDIERPQI